MKKLLMTTLLFMMFIPMFVNAETCNTDKIYIESISMDKKTGNTIEIKKATAQDKRINLNLSMQKLGDTISYRIKIKNTSNEDYELDKNTFQLNSDYVKYSFKSNDESNTVKAKSSKIVNLNIEYTKAVPEEHFKSGTFNDNKSVLIKLSSGNSKVNNPKTGINLLALIIILVCIFIITMYVLLRNNKYTQFMVLVFGLIMLLPFGVYAICKCEILVDSNVTIREKSGIDYIQEKGSKCGLIEDEHKELRFTGENPCNYIVFNNEIWRVIGVFDTKSNTNSKQRNIKIMRNESIGNYSWDTSSNQYSETDTSYYYLGYNEWSDADLMYELNGDYLNSNLAEDTYWFDGIGNSKRTLFNHSLVINETSKSYIDEVVWHLGGVIISDDKTASDYYNMERSDNNCEKVGYCSFGYPFVHRTSEWLGKVGLIYYSDYHYSNGWMNSLNLGKTITPWADANFVTEINKNTVYPFASGPLPVHPSLYLKNNLKITGDGTLNKPFVIQ